MGHHRCHRPAVRFSVTLVSNVYLTEGRTASCRMAAGREALLAAMSALTLIGYPARGYRLPFDVDHSWRLIRLRKAHDDVIAAAGLIGLALIEIALAATGAADQPTMKLGPTVVASFLVGGSAAVLLRSRQEPQSDLPDSPSPSAKK